MVLAKLSPEAPNADLNRGREGDQDDEQEPRMIVKPFQHHSPPSLSATFSLRLGPLVAGTGLSMGDIDRLTWRFAAEWVTRTLRLLRETERTIPTSWPMGLEDARAQVARQLPHGVVDESVLARRVHEMAVGLWPDVVRRPLE
jgi:hypothetical protein